MGLLLSMGCEPEEGETLRILFACSSYQKWQDQISYNGASCLRFSGLGRESWVWDLENMQKLPFRDSNKDQTKINLTRSIAKEVEDRDKVTGHWNEFQG